MKVVTLMLLAALSVSLQAQGYERQITIAAPEYAPYVSETLAGNGWAWEIIEAAFEGSAFATQLRILPWSRALRLAEEGAVDALYIANKTPERERWALFSDPVGDEVSVFWIQRDSQLDYDSLEQIRTLNIGTLRNSSQMDMLQRQGLKVVPLNDFSQGIGMLSKHRLDLMLADRDVVLNLMHANPSLANRIKTIGLPVSVKSFHLAVSRLNPQHQRIVDNFNQGLARIRADGSYNKILRKYGVLLEQVAASAQ